MTFKFVVSQPNKSCKVITTMHDAWTVSQNVSRFSSRYLCKDNMIRSYCYIGPGYMPDEYVLNDPTSGWYRTKEDAIAACVKAGAEYVVED